MMKKAVCIILSALCFGLSSCRPQKEAASAPAAGNPYLTRYLSAAPDSLNPLSATDMERKKEELNLDRLHEKVNPVKDDGLWGSTIRDILESIFSKKH